MPDSAVAARPSARRYIGELGRIEFPMAIGTRPAGLVPNTVADRYAAVN
jgi:hypothetical protein